ncbi:hypothetical protein ABLE91_16520 [Aquabacter sp. CN5-332]|uniref:hypothetical protein n=1 Tax=Aquabacter sp. CN5-332 TaxID=3156608 RepID=UPI0032B46E6D
MGTVVAFPVERSLRPAEVPEKGESARIYILPVIRIERHDVPVAVSPPPRRPQPGHPRRFLS